MRVKAKRKEGESTSQFLRRFSSRVQKSGLVNEAKRTRARVRKLNEREKLRRRLYRLKLQSFIGEKMKGGWSFEKAYQMGRKYIGELKYKG